MNDIKIGVAIPAFNEGTTIGSVALESKKHATRVLVVDDGSTDSTAEISSLADVEIIKHPKNLGKGVSLKTAFKWAIKNKLDILVTLDGDGQHNPNEIPTLIKPIVIGNADAVNGSRFMEIDNHAPGYRKLGQNLLTTATNIGSKSNTSDSQNGFRAFSKKTFDSFRFKTSGMGIESEMLIDLAKKGFTIVEIPISCKYNVNMPSKKNPISHGISVLLTIVKFVGADRPLTFFGIPGLIALITGVYFGINVVNIFYATSEIALGTALIMLLLIISGIFAIFAGLILYVISSTIKSLSG